MNNFDKNLSLSVNNFDENLSSPVKDFRDEHQQILLPFYDFLIKNLFDKSIIRGKYQSTLQENGGR